MLLFLAVGSFMASFLSRTSLFRMYVRPNSNYQSVKEELVLLDHVAAFNRARQRISLLLIEQPAGRLDSPATHRPRMFDTKRLHHPAPRFSIRQTW